MLNREEILNAIESVFSEYKEVTFDFIQSEAHCRSKMLESLKKEIQGRIEIETDAIPKQIMEGHRVQPEISSYIPTLNTSKNLHDICILKEGAKTVNDQNMIESIIEIKHGYNFVKQQVCKESAIGKDLRIVHYYSDPTISINAFLIYFMANSFEIQNKNYPEQIKFYKETIFNRLKKEADEVGYTKEISEICRDNIFFVFLDRIVDGNMKKIF